MQKKIKQNVKLYCIFWTPCTKMVLVQDWDDWWQPNCGPYKDFVRSNTQSKIFDSESTKAQWSVKLYCFNTSKLCLFTTKNLAQQFWEIFKNFRGFFPFICSSQLILIVANYVHQVKRFATNNVSQTLVRQGGGGGGGGGGPPWKMFLLLYFMF